MAAGLRIRKLADKTSDGPPWPLAGVRLEGELPDECGVSTRFVAAGRVEGWIDVEGEQVVHRPGGPPEEPWRVTHTFVQADVIIFRFLDGDVRYRVTHQPDKYVDSDDDTEPVTDEVYAAGQTKVDFFYWLEREEG